MAVLCSNQGEKCSPKEGDKGTGEVIQFIFLKGVAPPCGLPYTWECMGSTQPGAAASGWIIKLFLVSGFQVHCVLSSSRSETQTRLTRELCLPFLVPAACFFQRCYSGLRDKKQNPSKQVTWWVLFLSQAQLLTTSLRCWLQGREGVVWCWNW